MAIENWGRPGMPPVEYDVLDRWVIPHSPDAEVRTEWIWVRGKHPHLGKVINDETFVEIYFNYEYRRINKNFYNLSADHPLYDSQGSRKE